MRHFVLIVLLSLSSTAQAESFQHRMDTWDAESKLKESEDKQRSLESIIMIMLIQQKAREAGISVAEYTEQLIKNIAKLKAEKH